MELEKRIIDALKEDRRGLTITDLSKKLKKSRITVRIRLEVLKERGTVDSRNIGPSKLYFIKE